MAGFGKRKDGQAYPKNRKTGTSKRGSTKATGKNLGTITRKLKKLKEETVYVSMYDEDGIDTYEEPITLKDLADFHYGQRVSNRDGTFPSMLTIGSVSRFGQSGRDVVDIVNAAEKLFVDKFGTNGYQKVMNQLVNELDSDTKVDPDVMKKVMTAKEKEDELKKNYKSKNGFKDEKFLSAFEKDKILDDWNKFLKSDFDPILFTADLYDHLTAHASFIAHYDRGGFYNYYFNKPENTLLFLKMFDAEGEMKSAEYGDDYWRTNSTGADLNKGLIIAFTPFKKKIYLTLRNESLGEDEKRLESMNDKIKAKRAKFKKDYG